MKVRKIYIEAIIKGYWRTQTLEKIMEGEKSLYIINNRLADREEMKSLYIKYRQGKDFTEEIKDIEISKEEKIKKFYGSIDQHTEYIEDFEQQKKAEEFNRNIKEIIKQVESL